MKDVFKYPYILIAALLMFAGCSDDIEVSGPTRKMAAEFDLTFIDAMDEGDNGVLAEHFVDGRSVILISQRGTSLSIDFNDTTFDLEGNEIPNQNLYKYVYYTNDAADWDNYYNFQPSGNRALNWDYMTNNRLNGEYALGALFYPVDYKVLNSVEQDQSILENLQRSNILGAWHRTQDIKSRLKFRFFHLMEAIRVQLLIPVWDPADNSGFGEDAAKSGDMLSMITDFDVDWSLNKSSEQAPEVHYKIDGVEPRDIRMYLESVDNTVRNIKYSDITTDFPELEESVRTATFVVLFPPQQPVNNGPAMRFKLETMGGMEKSYVWNTSLLYGNPLVSAGGRVNNLILYLPRKENNAILIKAHILDWVDADSSFTVIPDDETEE